MAAGQDEVSRQVFDAKIEMLIAKINAIDDKVTALDRMRIASVETLMLEKIAALKELLMQSSSAAMEAIRVARQNEETWRAVQNEWRGALEDKDRNFVRREEHTQIVGDVGKLQLSMAEVVNQKDLANRLSPITQDIMQLRTVAASGSAKSTLTDKLVTNAIAIVAILVAMFAIYTARKPSQAVFTAPSVVPLPLKP